MMSYPKGNNYFKIIKQLESTNYAHNRSHIMMEQLVLSVKINLALILKNVLRLHQAVNLILTYTDTYLLRRNKLIQMPPIYQAIHMLTILIYKIVTKLIHILMVSLVLIVKNLLSYSIQQLEDVQFANPRNTIIKPRELVLIDQLFTFQRIKKI